MCGCVNVIVINVMCAGHTHGTRGHSGSRGTQTSLTTILKTVNLNLTKQPTFLGFFSVHVRCNLQGF